MQKLAEICVRRPVFATMLILALVVLGLNSYRKLGVDLLPKIEFPTVTITTTLRGASPEEVESQVTRRIEEAVNTISGIDELRSLSAEGVSIVAVTFVLEKDPDVAAQEIRDRVSAVVRDLPRDADQPVIEKIATDATPVISIAVSAPRDLREITKLVDDRLKKNLESLAGVGQVRFVGDRQRQIHIWLDGEKLYAYNLNIDQVRAAIAAQNVEIPGGRMDQGLREVSLRTLGRIERPQDFAELIVANVAGAPVRVRDIGRVEDGVAEPRSLARLDGEPAVVLEVRKQAGTNTLEVIRAVKARVEELKKALPPDFRVAYMGDQSLFIEASFKAVQEHLILGGLFAGLVVLLFIRSWRTTLIAAVAIPTSIVSTYTLMHWMGFTLNQITMLALVLVVGVVIDDAIVVLENIFRNAEERKLGPVQAAIEGTREIALAVMATTLSLVIIFLPVAMMGGIVGRFMSSFGWTAAFAIMVSLLVSFTLTPMLSSRFLRLEQGAAATRETALYRALAGPYRRMLRWAMQHRWAVVLGAALVGLSTVPLLIAIGKDFLPVDDRSEFEVTVRMPVGSSLEGSDRVMRELEAELRELPGVTHLLTLIGSDVRRQVDRGVILVELVPPEQRRHTQQELMAMARERLRRFRDLTVSVQLPAFIQGAGSAATKDLLFFIQGPDFAQLERYMEAVKKRLAALPGVTDLESSYEPGKPELRVSINREKAADLNVSVASIATALRTLVGGDEQVTTYREGEDRYDVALRVDKAFRDSPGALERLYVPSATLGNVPLASVVRIEPGSGPVQIDRVNRQRQILISANLAGGQALSNVLPVLEQAVRELDMGPEYRTGLLGRSREFGRASLEFVVAFVLAIVFMYMVLAAQFESFIDPVTILVSLPLSAPFALLSLMAMGENFSIVYSSLGILMLFGIVKKNSILQIDRIKRLRREHGMERLEAILRGCEDRLRPILMTTATLVAGMIPMAVGTGAGAGTRRTVAVVVIGGQSLCLLLTLLVTPVVYSLFDDLAHSPAWGRLAAALRLLSPRRAWASMTSLFALILVLAAPLAAQTSLSDHAPRVGVGLVRRSLSLSEAVQAALRSNLDIELERVSVASARQGVKAAQGYLDPIFRWTPALESRNTPTSSILMGAGGRLSEHLMAQNFYWRLRLPWQGAALSLDFENARQSTSNPFVSLNPFVSSRLSLGVSLPLLRNRTLDRERAELRIRRRQLEGSEAEFEQRVTEVIARVEQAYWDLVAAREAVQVLGESVELAREQLARTRRMVESQTLAPVEISAAEAELERRVDSYYAGLNLLTEAENGLKLLLAGGREEALWAEEIVPSEVTMLEPPTDDLRQAVATALDRRPELRALRARQQAARVQSELSAEMTKPQLNLLAGYANAGLAGSVSGRENPFSEASRISAMRLNELSALAGLPPVPVVSFGGLPEVLVGGYGTALSNLFARRYQSLQAGLSLDLNLRNRAAEANLAQARLAERRLALEQARLEQAIEAQVRNALQALETARQRMRAAEASARAARDKLESEVRLFQAGESTGFMVLTRQNEYSDSRRREVVARLEANKAVSRLRQAMGLTLEAYGIRAQ
ncbi:MAG: efflux RND transporter permease subunit [Bryobacteraceae bacterium]|nr:efflux RND transporter permease subunit [Bryobacteraceae bacterium]